MKNQKTKCKYLTKFISCTDNEQRKTLARLRLGEIRSKNEHTKFMGSKKCVAYPLVKNLMK
jgi:hypothetical protein